MRGFLLTLACLFPWVANAQTAPSVDEATARTFAERVATLANAGDCAALERAVDISAIVARGLEGIPLRATERMSLSASVSRSFMTPSVGLLAVACEGTANGRRVVFRGRGNVDGREVVRFRMTQRQGGTMFFDFELGRNGTGEVVAVDIFQAMLGFWTSAEVRDQAVPIGASNSAFARSLDARGRLLAANVHTMQQLTRAASAGDVATTTSLAASLPQALAEDASTLRLRIVAAQVAGDLTAYRVALDDFLRLHPNNVAANTFALDHSFLRRDFAAALEATSRLERLIERDPAFDLVRANLLSHLRRQPEAASFALRAATGDPDSVDAWLAVLMFCTAEGRHADAARAYQALVRLSAVPSNFATDPLFARLRASPELRAAMAR